jgi:hypothetical protein
MELNVNEELTDVYRLVESIRINANSGDDHASEAILATSHVVLQKLDEISREIRERK